MQHRDSFPERPRSVAPKILLTDTNRWPSPARLAIVLAQAGCDVSAVCASRHPLMYTRAVRKTFPYGGLRPLESLTAAIKATEPEIIIPCDDRGVEHLHELFVRARGEGASGSNLAALIERSLGSPESYPMATSRYALLEIAREEGLRTPATKLIREVGDLKSWHEEQSFPCVLKADGTFGGRGVRIAQSEKQAEQFFLGMSRPHPTLRVAKRLLINRDPFWIRPWWKRIRRSVIAQGHVRGRPANCGVFCWEGKVLAGIGVEVVSSEGLMGPATVVRVVDNPEMTLAAERIARRLGLSGFFGLDFMIEAGTGLTYLIEMNPRCTPLSHLRLGRGRDMTGALWTQLSRGPFLEAPTVTEKDMIAYFPQAWITKSEFLESSFQDVPRGEPDLVQELLRPWPDRSLLFRLGNALTAPGTT
jgi:hypothetical protein